MQRKRTFRREFTLTTDVEGEPRRSFSLRAWDERDARRIAAELSPEAFGKDRAHLISVEEAPPFVSVKDVQDFIYEHKNGSSFIAYSGNRRAYSVLQGTFRGYEARANGGSTFRYYLDGRIERRES